VNHSRRRFLRGVAIGRRRGLNDRELLVSEGLFSGTATAAHQSFFVPLLVHLGIGSGALGLYSAFNGLMMNVSGLAGSRVVRRLPNRRVLAALASGLGRGMFLLMALILLVQGNATSTAVLIALALISATFIGLGLPATTSMVADAVETRERGSFFANRLVASTIGAAIVSLGVAALLGYLEPPNGFTASYLLAGLAGIGSVACLLAIRSVHGPSETGTSTAQHVKHAPISPVMRRYAVATFILWFGAAMVAPILTPFILDDLGASASFIGLQGAVSAGIAILCQRWWGRRVDRFGSYGVLLICTVAVSTLPPLYAVAPTYWFGLGYEVIAAIGWSGYALGSLNFAVELAPDEERSHYTAVNNAAAGMGAFLGPLTGAALAGVISVEMVLFIAGGVRLLSFVALRFARPGPATEAERRLRSSRARRTIADRWRTRSTQDGEGRTGDE
jgi:MFS family permease